MNIEQLKAQVRDAVRAELPHVTVQISPLSENAGDLGVSVFAVERQFVRRAKDIILNLDCELCAGTDVSLTPMVRDMETTRQHYPQYLPAWTSDMVAGSCGTAELTPVALVETQEVIHSKWVAAPVAVNYVLAANEELALAA